MGSLLVNAIVKILTNNPQLVESLLELGLKAIAEHAAKSTPAA